MIDANSRGAIAMALAMLGFAIEDVLLKSATATYGVGPLMVQFGLVGMLIFASMSLWQKERIVHPAITSRPLIIRSLCELGGRMFFTLALAFAPLASLSSILQATPLFVTFGAAVIFGEKVGWRRWLAMGIGFCGVLLILKPAPGSFELGSLFAFLGMLGFAGRDLATRASPASMSMAQLGSVGFAVIIVAGVIVAVAQGDPWALPDLRAGVSVLAASVFGVMAYGALTVAMRSGEVSLVAPFRYTRLVFALALAVLIFGERPDFLTLLGGGVIVLSGMYSLLRERR
ncbi:MAG: DMT family transporter [Thalassovita sp.]